MEALLTETVGSASWYVDYRVVTVFIGGGTPSVVSADWIERLLATVRKHYFLAPEAEVTIELNPGTVSWEKLNCYYRAGINRLSIGLQSAHDQELAMLGRIHTWKQFVDTYVMARRAGFGNINVDLMSALPGQTPSGYRETLEKVMTLVPPPEHISVYSLMMEEGTPFYERWKQGLLVLPEEETEVLIDQEGRAFLEEKGYHRYEISNYAREGFECRHNCGYWRRRNYVGFGLGAASLVNNSRFRNGQDLGRYLENPLECREETQSLSRKEQMEEFMFLGLRMTAGVSSAAFERLFGCSIEVVYGDVLRKSAREGLLCTDRTGNEERIFLTEMGLDVSNYVMAQFLLT